MSWVMVVTAAVGATTKLISSSQDRKQRKNEQERANAEMAAQKTALQGLDMSNPYANLVNPYEGMVNPYEQAANPYANMGNVYSGMGNVFAGMENQFAVLENVYEVR